MINGPAGARPGFWSRLRSLLKAAGGVEPEPQDDLLRDNESFWNAVSSRPSDVLRAFYSRYPLVPRSYIDGHFSRFTSENAGNPRALLYLDAELGAPDRAIAYLKALECVGVTCTGARCLDIGCSNGALLLAAAAQGASRAVGAEISERRAMSARMLTKGSGVEVLVHDIACGNLPDGYGPFDLIFCIDVLEHVSSATATLTAIKRHLDTGPRARAFISVFNPRHPDNVIAEPHYGVPAMVLLQHEDAKSLWSEVRDSFGSRLEYEVSDWISYSDLIETLRQIGFAWMPFVDSRPILDRGRPFWHGFRERCQELETRVSEGIQRLPARPELKHLLLEHLRQYCARYLQDHLTLSSSADVSDETLLHFFMDYYAQPIQLVLRHAEAPSCNTEPMMGVPVESAKVRFLGYPPSDSARVRSQLERLSPPIPLVPFHIDTVAFKRYLDRAKYPSSYRKTFGDLFFEKALEHFVSLELMPAGLGDVVIDIASCSSPFADIVERLEQCTAYRQDLDFPPGLHDRTVGGSAENLPFADGFFSRMTLHCSFEHFEGEADIGFVREVGRVLRPGGAACILPLYLSEVFHNVTDPGVERQGLFFDEGAAVAEVHGWRNRFGRFYDAAQLSQRVLRHLGPLEASIRVIENEKDVASACYLKFALLLRKPNDLRVLTPF